MTVDWSGSVKSSKGGYMRLEDFCNTGPRSNSLVYTSGIITAEEELLACELGSRVANAVIEKDVDGWDALMELSYMQRLA